MIFTFKGTLILTLIILCHWQITNAQSVDSVALIDIGMGKHNEASPGVEGNRKGKAIEFNYSMFPAFGITSDSKIEGLNDSEAKFDQAKSLEFKLKVPVILKPRTKVITGISYKYEEYKFNNPQSLDYPLYENLEDKHLKSLSLDFYLLRSLKNYHFFLSKSGLELNGDFSDDSSLPFTRFLKYSVSGLYGWRKDKNTAYAFGLYLSYTFGRPRIYPAFLWNKTFNEHWGIEALLPANFYLRYNISPSTILVGGFDVEGASYHLNLDTPPLSQIKTLELRKSDIRLLMTLEQEIYDFLWFSITGGYRFNINFNLDKNNDFSNDIILENNIENTPFVMFSIFAVPPQSLSTKFNKKMK